MRPYHILYLALAGTPAAAQTAPDAAPPTSAAPGAAAQTHVPMPQRFASANTTHDGRLTMAQAQAANWRRVVRHFTEIDRGSKSYVTIEDIRAFNQAQHAAKPTQ